MTPEVTVPGGAAVPEPVRPRATAPVAHPVMHQGWLDLTSVHWRYDPEVVQRLLPPGFRVDTFDGAAWVGIIPFLMHRVRPPGLPPLGRLSTFLETNVRTYLVAPDGRRGVWFASLDVTRLVPALVARATYGLPYCWARMRTERTGDVVHHTSRRRWPRSTAGASVDLRVRLGEVVPPDEVGELEHFVTARWGLGNQFGRLPLWAAVDHGPWMLRRAELLSCDESLTAAAGLPPPEGEPLVLWSPGVQVRIGRPRVVWGTRGPRP